MSALAAARAYQRDLSRISRQTRRQLRTLWRAVGRGDVTGSWSDILPQAIAWLVAAQVVTVEIADPYLAAVLPDTGTGPGRVDPAGFAGTTPLGLPAAHLMFLPALRVLHRLGGGASAAAALRAGEWDLMSYARTSLADTAREAVSAAMATQPHASGFYRMLTPPACARCAVLAGAHYRYNQGFLRHDRCQCVHVPVAEADDSLLFDARAAIEAGQVRGLSAAERHAIVELGANPAQVINARRGMSTVGQRRFTVEGTTRRGIAGARILARDIERAAGRETTGRVFTNFTIDRHRVAQHAHLLRGGTTYARGTRTGRLQTYRFQHARAPRPTPGQILIDASSRDEAVRLLTNFGYIL